MKSLRTLGVMAVALVACRGGHAAAPAAAVTTRQFTVAPGEFAELNLQLPAAATVEVGFTASAPVAWNIHSHPAGEVVIHREGIAAEADVPFTADTAGGYSYLWENKNAEPLDLEIRVRLPDGSTVDSWHPE
jgi:hypothetical protein